MPSRDDPRPHQSSAGPSSAHAARTSSSSDDATLPPEHVSESPPAGMNPSDGLQAETVLPNSGSGAAERGPAAPPTGTTVRYFGDYELLEEVARGGMGVVYKARQVTLNRVVALKMILAGQLASEADVQRFHIEAEAAARLDHPGIVPIHEVGLHEGQHYFSMGFVEGQSLADKLSHGPLPTKEAAELTQQLAKAVAYAHEQGVIHRDLKPANVLLDNNGMPRITDFGLAKKLEADSNLTGTGQILGTPSYMPPEQAAGNTQEIGPAADVYAIGAVLYSMLTGRPPFQAANPMDTLMQVLDRDPVPLRQMDRAIARDLETICLKCLAKPPQRRYASASELSEELQRFLEGKPIRARPVSAVARARRWCQRKPLVAGLLFAVTISLIAGTAVSSYFAILARRRAEVAEREQNRAESQLERSEWLLYAGQIAAAKREWVTGNQDLAWEYLNACRWDFRSWEHDWLYTLFTKEKSLWGPVPHVSHVAFSSDSRRIACGYSDNTIRLWDVATGVETLRLEGHTDEVIGLAFSPDGRWVASGSSDKTVILWDANDGTQVRTLEGHTRGITSLAFSPDGRWVASGSYDETVKLWDAKDGRLVRALEGHTSYVTSVAFSPDGRWITSGSGDKTVKLWDATNGALARTIEGHTRGITSLAFSPDGQRIVSGSEDRTLRLWDSQSGEEILKIEGNDYAVRSVAFSPDGRRIGSGSSDRSARIWDAETGEELSTFIGSRSGVVFSPDGRWVASADGSVVRLRHAITEEPALTFKGYSDPITSMAFSPDGRWIVSGSRDKKLKVWDANDGRLLQTIKGHAGEVLTVAFSPDGQRIASGASDKTLRVWDSESCQELWKVDVDGPVTGLAFSPDGLKIASADGKPVLRVWDVASGQEVLSAEASGHGIDSVAFTANGKQILGAGQFEPLKGWDAETGEEVLAFEEVSEGPVGPTSVIVSADAQRIVFASRRWTFDVLDAISGKKVQSVDAKGRSISPHGISVAISPDGRWAVAALKHGSNAGGLGGAHHLNNTLKVWDIDSGQELLNLVGHTDSVNSVAISSDGRRIASGGEDGTLRIWDGTSGEQLLSCKVRGHTGDVRGVAFSPDGRHAVSASLDGTLIVWNAITAEQIRTLEGHTSWVSSVAFSPDGRRIVSGSWDATVRVWNAANGQEMLIFKGHKSSVGAVAFSHDGRRIASASTGVDVRQPNMMGGADVIVWDAETGTELVGFQHFMWYGTPLRGNVAFSPDGRRILVARKVYDAQTGRELLKLEVGNQGAGIAFSPDGKRIAGKGLRNRLNVWDANSGQLLIALKGHTGSVEAVAFSPDGRRIVSGSSDNTLKLWDVESGHEVVTLQGHADSVGVVAFSADGRRIVSGSDDDTFKIWDATRSPWTWTRSGCNVAFSPDGRRIASGAETGGLDVWDVTSGQPVLTVEATGRGGSFDVLSVAFSPDGRRIVGGRGANDDGSSVHVWDSQSGKQLLNLKGHTSRVLAVAFSRDGNRIVSGSADQMVRIRDARNGYPMLTLEGEEPINHINSVTNSVAFSPDGRRVVSASNGHQRRHKVLKVWDARNGKLLLTLEGHTGQVKSAAFSPDGRWIASASLDGELKVWDASSGNMERTIKLPSSDDHPTLAFSSDGQWIAVAGYRWVSVWDTVDWRQKFVLRDRQQSGGIVGAGIPAGLAFSPDGQRIVSARSDGRVKVWDTGRFMTRR